MPRNLQEEGSRTLPLTARAWRAWCCSDRLSYERLWCSATPPGPILQHSRHQMVTSLFAGRHSGQGSALRAHDSRAWISGAEAHAHALGRIGRACQLQQLSEGRSLLPKAGTVDAQSVDICGCSQHCSDPHKQHRHTELRLSPARYELG